jgi:hypothetical protein
MNKDEDLAATLALRRSLVSDDRQRHNRVLVEKLSDGFGSRARVQPCIERMAQRGQITVRQARAAVLLYEDWALGILCARDAEAGGSSVPDPGGYRDRQLDAATSYRRAREAVGLRMWPCLFAIVIEDFSVERFANERGGGTDRKGWAAILKLSLDVLADFYGL